MKRIVITGVTAAMLLSSAGVFAADYTADAPSPGIFGKPTSVTTVYVADNVNKAEIDKSKNSSLIPPIFGSPTSNLRGSGEPLTPNLASVYTDAQSGTKIVGNITASSEQPTVTVSSNVNENPQMPGNVTTSTGNSIYIPGTVKNDDKYYYEEEAFTQVTSSMYYSGGYLGTLKIPELNLSVKIYEGTANSVLKKGVGHFKDTSIWNGNVCLAAHNRGANDYFGEIHNLNYGDTIKLTTKKGTRTYKVFNVEKISVNDTSNLQGTSDNIITLITCVKNQADYYRWCVQGCEIE